MSSENQYYSLVTLNDHLFAAGFAGMRAALLARKSPAGWSAVSAAVRSMEIGELPPLGTAQQTKGNLTAWIVE